METIVKYLVSQHFGRIAAVVEFNESRTTGTVHLVAETPALLDITLSVDPRGSNSRMMNSLVELTVRQAMAQVLKLAKKSVTIPTTSTLEFGTHPWIGDLFDEPYGGATAGIRMLEIRKRGAQLPGEDRRPNKTVFRPGQRTIPSQ